MIGDGVRRSLRSLSWGLEAASRAVLYLDIGTRSLDSMLEATVDVWSEFNLEPSAVEGGWMLWERRLVEQFVKPANRVLLVGSGTGRDLIPFVEMGCVVTGVEPAPRAVDLARRALTARGMSATLVEGFVEQAPFAGVFDVMWFSYCCYSYIFDSSRRVSVLRKLHRHLADEGRIVLTCHGASDGQHPQSRLLAIARTANRWRDPGWRLEPGDMFEPWRGKSPSFQYVHIFPKAEVESEAARAGFSLAATDVSDAYVLTKSQGPPATKT
ncbi:MAG TPA: class I SAM-dependent methyltransferase [Vicinamibacterales bacterium]|nr:class I SAM-dependent methyltransferase [Vicinamibacterales bacterium]